MESSSELFRVNLLLLVSEHVPVEESDDHVADNAQGVEHMVSGLHVTRGVRGLKCVFSKVNLVSASFDGGPKGNSCQHQSPVREGDEETVSIHVQEVRDVAYQSEEEHQISHSLSCIDPSLRGQLLLCRKVLKLG